MFAAGTIALAAIALVLPVAPPPQDASQATPRSIQLRDAIVQLTEEVRALRAEIRLQQAADPVKFNILASKYQIVLLDIQRLRAEEKDAMDRLAGARARELDAQNRLANIQQELVLLADVNRGDSETRLRRAYTVQLASAREESSALVQRLAAVRERLERTEAVAEALRKRLKIHPSQIDEIEREALGVGE